MDGEENNLGQIAESFAATHAATCKDTPPETPAPASPAQPPPAGTASEPSPPIISGYAATHCATCAAGLLQVRPNGTGAAYCLIVRDWMSDGKGQSMILGCSRWEAAQDAK